MSERVFKLAALFEQLAARVNADSALVQRGRYVTAQMVIGLDDERWSLTIDAGRITDISPTDQAFGDDTLLLAAPLSEWQEFWREVPPPGSHDLFALLKRRVLTLQGDLHPFMANMMYFKQVLAMPRSYGPHSFE